MSRRYKVWIDSHWGHSTKIRKWAKETIHSHRANGYIVDITLDEMETFGIEHNKCAICGRSFNWSTKIHGEKPSVDRIDNEMFMDITNIQMACLSCNTSKGARTMKEFKDYCSKVVGGNLDNK